MGQPQRLDRRLAATASAVRERIRAKLIDAASTVREDEIEFPLWAGELPLSQGVHHHRRQRHGAFSRLGFGPTDGVVPIGALMNPKLPPIEIHI